MSRILKELRLLCWEFEKENRETSCTIIVRVESTDTHQLFTLIIRQVEFVEESVWLGER